MNYGKINHCDIANGEGVRVSLFVSGCPHHCNGCFNGETWDYGYGEPYRPETLREILTALEPEHIKGFSVLGGEPLDPQNAPTVMRICEEVKKKYPHKTIWLYTGYTYEQVRGMRGMELIDVIVDGEYIEAQRDITLKFRGSRNQRIIDVPRSRESNTVVLREDLM